MKKVASQPLSRSVAYARQALLLPVAIMLRYNSPVHASARHALPRTCRIVELLVKYDGINLECLVFWDRSTR